MNIKTDKYHAVTLFVVESQQQKTENERNYNMKKIKISTTTIIPNSIYSDTTPQEFMVMAVLYREYDSEEKCSTVSRSDLADECHMSIRNTDRILSSLKEKQLIKVHHNYKSNGRQIENSYELIYKTTLTQGKCGTLTREDFPQARTSGLNKILLSTINILTTDSKSVVRNSSVQQKYQ